MLFLNCGSVHIFDAHFSKNHRIEKDINNTSFLKLSNFKLTGFSWRFTEFFFENKITYDSQILLYV